MKILIIAPHPDDEVLGCGGTIKRYVKEGNEVYLCIITIAKTPDWSKKIIEAKKKEIIQSGKILGIKKTFLLNFPASRLDTIPQRELNDSILSCINKVNPEILYVPFNGDVHKDHRLVFEASMVAARPKSGCSIKKILIYEVLSETDWAFHHFRDMFSPSVYIDVSETIEDKIRAMSVYKTELNKKYCSFTLEGIKILARKRGIESGLEMAEGFVLVRDIIN